MLHSLIQWKPRDVPLRVALRNTAAIVVPLALGIGTGHVEVGVAVGTGALNTMFTDQPGPYRLRMQRMLLTALAAGLSAFVGSLAGASTPLLMLAALIWGIGGGLLVALGTDAGRAGMTSMILLLVTASEPRTPLLAAGVAMLIFAGGLLQTLFAIAAWPLQRYRPERHALAGVCRELAASTRVAADPSQAPPVTQALLDVERLLHGAHRDRGDVMDIFRVLAELLERVRLELLALGDLRSALGDRECTATVGRALEYAARALDALASALVRGATAQAAKAALEGFDAVQDALRDLHARSTERRAQRQLMIVRARIGRLGGQLRAALRNVNIAGSRGDLRRSAIEERLPRALRPRSALAILRANLDIASTAFRHALRCGVALALAVGVERALAVPHGYWIPMTIAIVLKPDFAGTFRVGTLRVAGTLAGLALTTALVHYAFGSEWERLGLMALLAIAFRLLATMHYGIAVTVLTGMVVILLSFHGLPPGPTMLARGGATVLGSALALVTYALWPSWETARVRPALANMLAAYREYMTSVLQGPQAARASARSSARSARTTAQASLDRLRGEPRPDAALLALAEAVFANANRFVRACMALEAVWPEAASAPARQRIVDFTHALGHSLDLLVARLRDASAPLPASLREAERALTAELAAMPADDEDGLLASIGEALDRMTDTVDTLAWRLRQPDARARPA